MRYVVLVSHGLFAPGLKSAVEMMTGPRRDFLSTSMPDGMDVDEYERSFKSLIGPIGRDDEILLFGDIRGGSPFTVALKALDDEGLLTRTSAAVGMNMPLVLSAVLEKDEGEERDEFMDRIVAETRPWLEKYEIVAECAEDEDDTL